MPRRASAAARKPAKRTVTFQTRVPDDEDAPQVSPPLPPGVTLTIAQAPAPAAPVVPEEAEEDIDWGSLPRTGDVHLYTTDPYCTWGKRAAKIDIFPAPLDVLRVRQEHGGGPYLARFHCATTGKILKSIRFALAGPSALRHEMDALGGLAPKPQRPGDFWLNVAKATAQKGELERREREREDDREERRKVAAPQTDPLVLALINRPDALASLLPTLLQQGQASQQQMMTLLMGMLDKKDSGGIKAITEAIGSLRDLGIDIGGAGETKWWEPLIAAAPALAPMLGPMLAQMAAGQQQAPQQQMPQPRPRPVQAQTSGPRPVAPPASAPTSPPAAPAPAAAAAPSIASMLAEDEMGTELLVVGRAAWKGMRAAVEDKPTDDHIRRTSERALALLAEKDVARMLEGSPADALAELRELLVFLHPTDGAILNDDKAGAFLLAVVEAMREAADDDDEDEEPGD